MSGYFRNETGACPPPVRCRGAAQSLTLWLFILLGIVLVAAALSATSLRDLLGSSAATAPTPAEPIATTTATTTATAPATATGSMTPSPAEFGIDQLRAVFSVLGENERARVLEDDAAFSNLVQNERARWAVIEAARSAGLESSPQVAYLMRRSAEQVLLDTYVKLNVGAAVPADFPSEDQVRQFYEANQPRYRVEARIPLWQIYLAIPGEASEAQVAEIEGRAKQLVASLRAGKMDFAKAAATQSAHEASRLNGGFMGNLKVDELIPEVKAAVTGAPVGKILEPVKSASGLHILRRGERIEATQLSLEQVRDQIRKTLRQAAETKARQLLVTRAREKAGDAPGEAELDSWRSALSTASAKAP